MEGSETEKYWKKICAFCTYRERSPKEAIEKLKSYGIKDSKVEQLLIRLQLNSYVDARRFAEVFARGKFNSRSWGKVKIAETLRFKGIEQDLIASALDMIEKDEYHQRAHHLALKKKKGLKGFSMQDQAKIIRYLSSKGYEFDLIFKIIKEIKN